MADVKTPNPLTGWRSIVHSASGVLSPTLRAAVRRMLVDCDPRPDARLELKLAETRDELEACFRLLHDAYVEGGFMKPNASGMRVTPFCALPTTTTLCAKYDGQVVGTVSLIGEGVFGFPLQSAFALDRVRAKGGNIAEASGLAIHPAFRGNSAAVLFPLMKFVRQYCVEYFDVQHLVIAVHPDGIDVYESLLFFERLQEDAVDHYEFANGAPAIGAELDMRHAAVLFKVGYRDRPVNKNLYRYFFQNQLPNIKPPKRRYFTTNDPVMTPELLDYFFNVRTQGFADLDERRKSLLWSVYGGHPAYQPVLPPRQPSAPREHPLRQYPRYSISCPASVTFDAIDGGRIFVLKVIEISLNGFQVQSTLDLPVASDLAGRAVVELGRTERSVVNVRLVRRKETAQGAFYAFELDEPDSPWRRCVEALEGAHKTGDRVL